MRLNKNNLAGPGLARPFVHHIGFCSESGSTPPVSTGHDASVSGAQAIAAVLKGADDGPSGPGGGAGQGGFGPRSEV